MAMRSEKRSGLAEQGSAPSLNALTNTQGDLRGQGASPFASQETKARAVTHNIALTQAGCSIDPLREEVAGGEFRCHVGRSHGRVLAEVLGVLPFEEFDAVLSVRLTAEV